RIGNPSRRSANLRLDSRRPSRLNTPRSPAQWTSTRSKSDRYSLTMRLHRLDSTRLMRRRLSYTQQRAPTTSRRKKLLSPGSVNRELAALRRLLRLAHEWKVIQRVPRVH